MNGSRACDLGAWVCLSCRGGRSRGGARRGSFLLSSPKVPALRAVWTDANSNLQSFPMSPRGWGRAVWACAAMVGRGGCAGALSFRGCMELGERREREKYRQWRQARCFADDSRRLPPPSLRTPYLPATLLSTSQHPSHHTSPRRPKPRGLSLPAARSARKRKRATRQSGREKKNRLVAPVALHAHTLPRAAVRRDASIPSECFDRLRPALGARSRTRECARAKGTSRCLSPLPLPLSPFFARAL